MREKDFRDLRARRLAQGLGCVLEEDDLDNDHVVCLCYGMILGHLIENHCLRSRLRSIAPGSWIPLLCRLK